MLNQIFNEDCLEGMKRIPDGSIDCIITDPPYGSTACRWDHVIPFDKMWEQLKRIIKPNGAIVLFGSEPFSSALRMSNIKNYKYDWIWEKDKGSNFLNAKHQPLKTHENISVFAMAASSFSKNTIMQYNPQMTYGKPYFTKSGSGLHTYHECPSGHITDNKGTRFPRSNLKINTEKGLHPTQKPVELIEYLIRTYTNEGETVLDFTIGSGTTAIACINTNRNYIGFELDKGYFDIANERIAGKLQNKK